MGNKRVTHSRADEAADLRGDAAVWAIAGFSRVFCFRSELEIRNMTPVPLATPLRGGAGDGLDCFVPLQYEPISWKRDPGNPALIPQKLAT